MSFAPDELFSCFLEQNSFIRLFQYKIFLARKYFELQRSDPNDLLAFELTVNCNCGMFLHLSGMTTEKLTGQEVVVVVAVVVAVATPLKV